MQRAAWMLGLGMLLAHVQAAPLRKAPAAEVVRQAGAHRLLILGEFHGTREVPVLVGEVVREYAGRGPVLLALEMPASEQPALDAALAAPTAAVARTALLARPWWRRGDAQHDGRRSLDMIDLVLRLRRWRARGLDVALLAYDVDADGPPIDPAARDRAMAGRVRMAYMARPDRRVVMLAGNVHAMLARPSYLDVPGLYTAGMALADLDPASLRIGALEGATWACVQGRCGSVPAMPAGTAERGEYTGAVDLPRLSVGRLVTAPSRSP